MDLDNIISNDSGMVAARIPGPTPTNKAKLVAARAIYESEMAGDYTVREILREAQVRELREHTDGSDMDCGCEDVGWFCPSGDGEPTYWLCLNP